AFATWDELAAEAGEQLITLTGGLDLFPADPWDDPQDYRSAVDAEGLPRAREGARRPPLRAPRGGGAHPPLAGVAGDRRRHGDLPGGCRDRGGEPRERGASAPRARAGRRPPWREPGPRDRAGAG